MKIVVNTHLAKWVKFLECRERMRLSISFKIDYEHTHLIKYVKLIIKIRQFTPPVRRQNLLLLYLRGLRINVILFVTKSKFTRQRDVCRSTIRPPQSTYTDDFPSKCGTGPVGVGAKLTTTNVACRRCYQNGYIRFSYSINGNNSA